MGCLASITPLLTLTTDNFFYEVIKTILSANVVHARHDADVACRCYSASYRQIIKNGLLKKEKISYKIVCI